MREHSAIHANLKGPARSHVELTINSMMKITVLKLSNNPKILSPGRVYGAHKIFSLADLRVLVAALRSSFPYQDTIASLLFTRICFVLPTTRRTDRLNLICYAMSILVKAEYYLYMGSDWHPVGFEIGSHLSLCSILDPLPRRIHPCRVFTSWHIYQHFGWENVRLSHEILETLIWFDWPQSFTRHVYSLFLQKITNLKWHGMAWQFSFSPTAEACPWTELPLSTISNISFFPSSKHLARTPNHWNLTHSPTLTFHHILILAF